MKVTIFPKERSSSQTHGPSTEDRRSTVQGMNFPRSVFWTISLDRKEMKRQMTIAELRIALVQAVECALASDWQRTHWYA